MLDNSQTLTINTTERTYTQVYDAEFAKELASGSCSVRKANITNGNSILKIGTSESKGVERHQILVRDKTVVDNAEKIDQAYVVASFASDDPTAAARTAAILVGLANWLTGTSGLIPKVLAGEQ